MRACESTDSICAAVRGFASTQSAPEWRKEDTSSLRAFPVSPIINRSNPLSLIAAVASPPF
jgi:hypothetical protein